MTQTRDSAPSDHSAPSDDTAPGHALQAGPTCSEERMVDLLAAIQALYTAPDLASGLDEVAARLRSFVPYDNLAVLLLGERGQELHFEYAVGYDTQVVEHWRFGLGQGIVGTAARDGETLLVDDVSDDQRYLPAAPSTRTELAIPLRVHGRVVGVLDLGCEHSCSLEPSRIRLLERLGAALALTLEARRLLDRQRDQTRLLSVLHQISRELTSILDRQEVLERMARRLKDLIDHEVFSVLLWSEESQVLEPWFNVTFDERPVHTEVKRLGEGITGTAAALRQPLRIPNVALDPRYVPCETGLEIRSELAVPLLFENRLIGVLDLESTRYDAFRAEHEQLLATLGASLAIALVNAEMYERVDRDQARMERDLRAAREVQQQLLPRSTPWIPGMQIAVEGEPARHLGGDFHDFLRYDDGRIAVIVGDVAGKSTSAALYGALAVGHLREIASHHEPTPGQMLALLNRKLRELEIDRSFVALACAVIDPATRSVQIANAGLPYPILLRDGRPIELELGGLPAGALADSEYREVEVVLGVGDSLVLLTDGVHEGRDLQGQEFGQDRVELCLRRLHGDCADHIAAGLLVDLRRFAGDEISDDRTVVVLRASEQPC